MATAQIPAGDCVGAKWITKTLFEETEGITNEGQVFDEIQNGQTCMFDGSETSILWYTFIAQEDGDFGFLIKPQNLRDDYDWVVFDITETGCAGLKTNARDGLLSCNAAGSAPDDIDDNPNRPYCNGITGADGSTDSNNQNGGCEDGNTALNALIPVEAGRQYVIAVQNWQVTQGGTFNGYTIDFSGSDEGVIGEQLERPTIQIEPLEDLCDRQLTIAFSQPISCSSLEAANLEAELLGADGTSYPVRLEARDCLRGETITNEVTVQLASRLNFPGTYTLSLKLTEATVQRLQTTTGTAVFSDSQIGTSVDYPFEIDFESGTELEITQTGDLCSGETITLTATPQPNLRFFQFTWFLFDYQTETAVELTEFRGKREITVTKSGRYQAVAQFGCRGTTQWYTVTNGSIDLDLGEDHFACEDIGFIRLAAENLSGHTYEWNTGETTPSIFVLNSGVYTLTVTNECFSVADEVAITIYPNRRVYLSTICVGEDYNFYGQMLTEAGTYTYTTEENGCPIDYILELEVADSTYNLSRDVTICDGDSYLFNGESLTEAGTYFLGREAVTGCTYIDILYLYTEYNAPEVSLGDDFTLCPGEIVTFNVTTPNATYEWDDGSTESERTITESGVYRVSVTNSCGTTIDEIFVIDGENCDDGNFQVNNKKQRVQLFPNPAQDQLQLDFGLGLNDSKDVRIIDLQGKIIWQTKTTETHLQLDIPLAWQTGIYFAQITTEQEVETLRFLIE